MVDTLDNIIDDGSIDSILEAQSAAHRAEESKPDISDLEDAVIENPDGSYHFVPDVGASVVIDRNSVMLPGNPWLDTRVYRVLAVNQTTGDLRLYNDDLRQHAMSNFITGMKNGFTFKIPTKKGISGVKKRRARRVKSRGPQKAPVVAKVDQKQPGLRRLYVVRGVLHCRLKSIGYTPVDRSKSQALPTDKITITPNASGAIIRHPEKGWEEQWVTFE